MTWPQAAHLGDALSDLWDAKLNARILQWDYAQTLRDPLDLYQLNFFHPAKYVLAFSENLYGVAVFGFPLLAAGASALVNYNVLLLLGMFLSALAAWALAREVTGDPIASAVSGLVFAFLPWRFSQLPHLQFQWAGFLCLSLLFLLRYLDRGRTRDLILYGICFRLERALQRALRPVLGVARRCHARSVRRRWTRGGPPALEGRPRGDAARGPRIRSLRPALPRSQPALWNAPILRGGPCLFGALDLFPLGRRPELVVRPCDRGVARPGGRPVPRLAGRGARGRGGGAIAPCGPGACRGAAAHRLLLAVAARARSGRRDSAARRRMDLVSDPGGTADRPAAPRGLQDGFSFF